LLILCTGSAIKNEALGQLVIDNEVLSSDNSRDSSATNKVKSIPQVHVTIQGTELPDKLKGGDGNDNLIGNDGNDILQGNEGDDKIEGEDGEDVLVGGTGDDEIKGGDDDDDIDGGDGDDEIKGGKGDDEIKGGDDDDDIDGGDGDDILNGNEGNDKIDGGDGNDVLNGNEGDDVLKGGPGADKFVCDIEDKIIDYNSLENDRILGQCKYEDKGTIEPKPILKKEISKSIPSKPVFEKNSLFPSSPPQQEDKDIFKYSISKLRQLFE